METISISFEIIRDDNTYRDAIILPSDHSYTEADIENMKEARYLSWLSFINSTNEEI
jgi:hypothetical protein